ncbi:MAG: hypothetical protein ACP5U2_01845 [Bryobacteraceae bacterium]
MDYALIMAEGLSELLRVLMRWVHVSSAAVLVGGMFYARYVADEVLAPARPRLRWWVWSAVAGLAVSGLYSLRPGAGHSRYYWIWMLIKLLLAVHVFVSAGVALVSTDEEQRRRRAASAAMAGLLVIGIAAYLRRLY